MRNNSYNIIIDWYDRLVDFTKQKLSSAVWFFLCSAILLFTPRDYLKLIYLDRVVDLFGLIIGLLFLLSGVLIAINVSIFCRNQYAEYKGRRGKKVLLEKLTGLYEIEELSTGFKSQQDCITWSNSVAPLLTFNQQYYANFMASSHQINNIGISGGLAGSLVNTMKSQVEMAIAELENELAK